MQNADTLAARFAAGAQPLRQLLLWGAQIAEALAEAHAAGRVHGALTPDNVVLDPQPKEAASAARLLDVIATDDAPAAPAYRPPESWQGTHGAAGDLYQLGLLLHEGVRGVPCFEGEPEALMRAHLYSAPPPLSGVDAAVSGTIMRLLIKASDVRPQSATEVAATLRVLANATPEAAQGLAPTAGGHWPAAETNAPSIVRKVWVFTSLSLLLVLAGILISSRLGKWDLPGSRVVEAPPVVFPQSTSSGWILPPAAAAASAASAKAARKAAASASSGAPRRP